MGIRIACAPSCWGVDDPNNPYIPDWRRVLSEASIAGYPGIETGPYGYMPLGNELFGNELAEKGMTIVAGTIFADLVDPGNRMTVLRQAEDICGSLVRLPKATQDSGQRFKTPYLTIMDYFHPERAVRAGHFDAAPRLEAAPRKELLRTIKEICDVAWRKYGVRPVIHPHAGGYIEFSDEIESVLEEIPYETAGICFDTGHSYYSGMDPVSWIRKLAGRIDYVHFKDVNPSIFKKMMGTEIDFFEACAKGVMCPIGSGCIDYGAVLTALKEIEYSGWATVEQERDPRQAGSSLDDVRKSLEFLRRIGFDRSGAYDQR